MKKMYKMIRVAALLFLLCGVIYPLTLTGVSNVIFAKQAQGSLIMVDGTVKGSSLIGQSFTGTMYLQGRPSATDYGTTSSVSGSSNLVVSSAEYESIIETRIQEFIAANPTVTRDMIPNDLIMESASGYDPHISYRSATIQIPRIVLMSGLDSSIINKVIDNHTTNNLVNVLEVNIELEALIQ